MTVTRLKSLGRDDNRSGPLGERAVIGFRTIYTNQPLPTGGRVFILRGPAFQALMVHEPSLLEDPRGVLDEIMAHRCAFLAAFDIAV